MAQNGQRDKSDKKSSSRKSDGTKINVSFFAVLAKKSPIPPVKPKTLPKK